MLSFKGVRSAKACLVLPVATGMSMVMTLLTLKQQRPGAKFVIWPRIDQKSCFKCILTAGNFGVPLISSCGIELNILCNNEKNVCLYFILNH